MLSRSLTDMSVTKEQIQKAVNMPMLQGWMMFAMSYGLTSKNGMPMQTGGIHEGSTIAGREMFEADKVAIPQAGNFAIREHDMLARAVTHYVSAEIVNEISLAVSTSTCDPLFETDLFTPVGFAVLEEPYLINDLDEDTGITTTDVWLAVRAFGWRRVEGIAHAEDNEMKPGIELFIYTTPEDYVASYVASQADRGRTIEHPNISDGFLIIDVIPWRFGSQWDINDDESSSEYVPGFLIEPVAYQRKWFHTFMRFCWQEIISKQRHFPSRPEQKRWDRMAKRKDMLDFTVLRLRRMVDTEHVAYEGGGVPLEHRVKVRAHWTRQFYPSLGPARLPDGRMNPDSHRLIWIESYWKGPEDGPIGPMHSATSVIR